MSDIQVSKAMQEGRLYTVNLLKEIGNDNFLRLRLKPNFLSTLYVSITVSHSGACLLKSYLNTTYTLKGTEPDGSSMTVFNRNTNYTDTVNDLDVTYNPTVDTLGVARGVRYLAGGDDVKATGAVTNEGAYTVVKAGDDLLLEIQNKSKAGGYFGLVLEVFTEEW